MFQEIYAESLELDAKVEELLGAEFAVLPVPKDPVEVDKRAPVPKGKGKVVKESPRQPSAEVVRLKNILYSINEDRKRLRTQNFSLICSQTLNPAQAATEDLAKELNTLVLELEREKEEKMQAQMLLDIASAQLKAKKENERKNPPTIEARVGCVDIHPEVPLKALVYQSSIPHLTSSSRSSTEALSDTPLESMIPSPRPSRIPVPSRIPQPSKPKK